MEQHQEHELRPEGERHAPSIRLEFLRHDEKEKEATSGSRAGDQYVRLTQKGREHSTEVGKEKDPHPEVGLVYGSLRERSTEAALRQLFANEDGIEPTDSLEDIRAKVGEHLRVGKKNIETSNLDFISRDDGEFHDALYEHYLGPTKDALIFMRDKSDEIVERTNDLESTSYSRAAGNVAELVEKYLGILPRWEQLATEKPEEYEKFNNELQRFLGSHQTVLEPFLMKVIERVDGPESVEKFLASLSTKNGFGYGEGFSVRLERDTNDQPVVQVSYHGQAWTLLPQDVEAIIEERDALDAGIRAAKERAGK